MKMSMMETAMVAGAMSILGYCYMKKNPEIMKKAKKMASKTTKMIYKKLECED